jgi:quercetin dioxygenase-like cupin family protein
VAEHAVQASAQTWIVVPDEALRGEGMAPYAPGEMDHLFDWAENVNGRSIHVAPHRGRFIVDIVDFEPNAVHQPSKPGDEVVVVLNGELTLTTDASGGEQVVGAGEAVLIPAGWAGIYRAASQEGWFRELTFVPGDYFDASVAPPPNDKHPQRIEFPVEDARRRLHEDRYALDIEVQSDGAQWPITGAGEQVVHVVSGELTLSNGLETATVEAGAVVVLPEGFEGKAAASPGYRSITVTWLR